MRPHCNRLEAPRLQRPTTTKNGVKTHTESEVFPGDRAEVRLRAVVHALELLERTCSGHALHE